MHYQQQQQQITFALTVIATLVSLVQSGAVSNEQTLASGSAGAVNFDDQRLRIISDEDQKNMEQIRYQIDEDFTKFKTINEVHAFLATVNLLAQKHPKNLAFAQGNLKDLHNLLTKEIVTKLIRLDAEPFVMPISDDKMQIAQRAIDEDELTAKLFSGPLRSLIEAKKQQVSRTENGNHSDGGNFFSNFWCKISGNCSN